MAASLVVDIKTGALERAENLFRIEDWKSRHPLELENVFRAKSRPGFRCRAEQGRRRE
jgi:hypothetical protein